MPVTTAVTDILYNTHVSMKLHRQQLLHKHNNIYPFRHPPLALQHADIW